MGGDLTEEEAQTVWQRVKETCVDKSRHRAFFTVSMYVLLGGAILFPPSCPV